MRARIARALGAASDGHTRHPGSRLAHVLPDSGPLCPIIGRLNDSRFLDCTLRLHKHAVHMGWNTVEAIAAMEGIDMIAYGHSDLIRHIPSWSAKAGHPRLCR
jgi:hypothetical protein